MRCIFCNYAQQVYNCDDDTCSVCWLTSEEEQTENKYGQIGCLYNQKTLDKRNREVLQGIKNGDYI